jgi:hypothetical protein
MGEPEASLPDPVTTNDELCSCIEAFTRPENVRPVSEAARVSAAPEAQLTAPNRSFYEETDKPHHSYTIGDSGSSRPGILTQESVTKRSSDESTEAATSAQPDLCLLENRLEQARHRYRRNQNDRRELVKVRCHLLAAQHNVCSKRRSKAQQLPDIRCRR